MKKTVNKEELEKYGDLKVIMESEGDGYFFWGYGLPSGFDSETEALFKKADEAINKFKEHVEKKIKSNGGDPEDYQV